MSLGNFFLAKAPPRRWMLISAWATVFHVVFQLAATLLFADERGGRWSVSTLAQMALLVVLGFGAFRRSVLALGLLGLFGSLRVVMLGRYLAIVVGGIGISIGTRLFVEYMIAIPVALIWIAGGLSAWRAMRAEPVEA